VKVEEGRPKKKRVTTARRVYRGETHLLFWSESLEGLKKKEGGWSKNLKQVTHGERGGENPLIGKSKGEAVVQEGIRSKRQNPAALKR